MSKLREKFENVNLCDRYTDAYEQITDDFSVKFAMWLSINCVPMNTKDGKYNFKGDIKTSQELQQY